MGGHADGERAAEIAQRSVVERFWQAPQPLLDPLGLSAPGAGRRAQERGGARRARCRSSMRPRATCAVCVVQQASAYWAHVGDSRIYHLRAGRGARAHARSQPRRAAGARGPDQRRAGAESPDAQLRRVLPRRRADPAGDGDRARAARCCRATCCWCAPTASGPIWRNDDRERLRRRSGLSLRETLAALAAQALLNAGGAQRQHLGRRRCVFSTSDARTECA